MVLNLTTCPEALLFTGGCRILVGITTDKKGGTIYAAAMLTNSAVPVFIFLFILIGVQPFFKKSSK